MIPNSTDNKCTNCDTINATSSKYCSICGYKLPLIESENPTTNDLPNTTIKNSKKFNTKTFLGFVVGFIIMFFVTQSLMNPPSMDEALVKVADEINKTCPFRVDQYITLDNAIALPNKTIQYNYTMVDIRKAEVNLDTVKKYIFTRILQNVKNSPDMKTFRDNNVTLNYYYKDKNGEFVTKYVVTPQMYQD